MSNFTPTFKRRSRLQHPEGMGAGDRRKFQRVLLVMMIALGLGLPTRWANAQSPITITSTPKTAAVENQQYSTTINATESNNDSLTFTAPVLPSWLTLSIGAGSSRQIANGLWIYGVAVDDSSNVYIADSDSRTIFKITPDGTKLAWQTMDSQNHWSYGMMVHDGYLYISYYNYYCQGETIKRVSLSNPAAGAQTVLSSNTISAGMGLTFKDGYLYFSSYACNKIGRVNLATFASEDYIINAVPSGRPWGLDFSPNGDLYVASQNNHGITKYAKGTTTNPVMVLTTENIIDIKFDAQGYMYAGTGGSGIRKYEPTLTTYEEISNTGYIYAIGRNSNNMFAYSDVNDGGIYSLQAGATLTGTPTHADLGDHPVKIKVSNGTTSVDQNFVIHVSDPNPPLIKSLTPANLSTDISLDTVFAIKFNEKIKKGHGYLRIHEYDTDTELGKIEITDNNIVLTNDSISLKATGLPTNTRMYITIEEGALADSSGNDFAGISSKLTWSFKTVAKSAQTITFAAKDTVTYGVAEYTPVASVSSGLPLSFVSSDPAIASIVDGKMRVHKAGQVVISANQPGNDLYLPATVATQTLTIKTKELVVNILSVPAITRVYDGNTAVELNAANYELTGLVNNDAVTVNGRASFDDKNVGSEKKVYVADLTLSGKPHSNYHLKITKDTASGAITPKQIEVALLAVPAFEKIYDGTSEVFADAENYHLTGVIKNDDLSVSGVTAFDNKNAGDDKTITGSMFELNGEDAINYQLSNSTASVKGRILKKEVSVIAHNKSKVYGATEPALTYDVTGLVEGETLEGSLARTNNKNVGVHNITIGSLSGGNNYSIVDYKPATLTITPAALVITADDKTKKQGQPNPAITFSYQGLTAGDSPADLTAQPQSQLSAVTGSPIGYYNIEVSSAASPNYTITYRSGRLTVTPAGEAHAKVWSSSASVLQIRIYSETAQKSTLFLFTQNGQPVIREQKQLQAGVNSFTMPIGSLNSGVYLFNVKAEKFDETQKVKIK